MLERMRQQNKPVTPQMEQLAAWMDGMDTEGADGMVRLNRLYSAGLNCTPQGFREIDSFHHPQLRASTHRSARCACPMSSLIAWLASPNMHTASSSPHAAKDSRIVDVCMPKLYSASLCWPGSDGEAGGCQHGVAVHS